MEKRTTVAPNNYWNETGAYNEEYSKLWDELVPAKGEAPTIHGELIRCYSRLQWDYCNNGNCNAVEIEREEELVDETCYNCDGDGEVENPYYDPEDEECEEDEMEECEYCEGLGYTEDYEYGDEEKTIAPYYQAMLDFLDEFLEDSKCVDKLEAFMLGVKGYSTYDFDDEEYKFYNAVADAVMHQVLTTENAENPYYSPEKDK